MGERVTTVRTRQRVALPFEINCGDCGACRAGLTSNCASVPPLSMYGFGVGAGHWGGVLADRVAVPYADAMLVPLPDGVDPAAAASVSDTICDGYRHIGPHLPRLLERDPDAEVMIVAALTRRTLFAASVPLYAGMVARALGARRVRLVDARAGVRAAAERLGLTPLRPEELRRARPAALVVAATATRKGLWAALGATAPDGICSSVGGLHRSARIPVMRLYGRNVTLHIGRTDARATMPPALELMSAGRFRPEEVFSTLGSLEDAPALLDRHYRTDDIKTVLTA
jgi:alcohol dehydrogenase